MFGTRNLKQYNKFEGPPAETSIIHHHFTPESESIDRLEFDVKTMGRHCHMSTTMYLERKLRVQVQLPDIIPESAVLSANADHTRQYRSHSAANGAAKFMLRPGFLLQENAENTYFNFNGGSVAVDSKWLGPYAKLYKKDLLCIFVWL